MFKSLKLNKFLLSIKVFLGQRNLNFFTFIKDLLSLTESQLSFEYLTNFSLVYYLFISAQMTSHY